MGWKQGSLRESPKLPGLRTAMTGHLGRALTHCDTSLSSHFLFNFSRPLCQGSISTAMHLHILRVVQFLHSPPFTLLLFPFFNDSHPLPSAHRNCMYSACNALLSCYHDLKNQGVWACRKHSKGHTLGIAKAWVISKLALYLEAS